MKFEYPESFSTADMVISGSISQPQVSNENVTVQAGTVINTYYPAAIQIKSSGKTVTVANSELHCNSIRNAAILFGDDAYWGDGINANDVYVGKLLDGTVTFTGDHILLDSKCSNCITAAGIAGEDLTVNFSGAANGAGGIRFHSSQGSGPANEAFGIKATGDLTVNGSFGGMVQSYFECSNMAQKRWGEVYGFSSVGDMTINGDITGTLAASAYTEDTTYDWLKSRAYGLESQGTLTVNGVISGTVVALAETDVWGIRGTNGVNVTISGTVYAGKSLKGQTIDAFLDKLADAESNKAFLLNQSAQDDVYAIYSSGTSDVVLSAGAEIWGEVNLRKGSSFTVSSAASVYGDVILYGGEGECDITFVLEKNSGDPIIDGALYDYNWGYSSFTIDATSAVNGKYVLADEFVNRDGVIITVEAGGSEHDLEINNGGKKSYTFTNGMKVEVDNANSSLTVTVTGSSNVVADNTNPVFNGVPVSDVEDNNVAFSWNAASDNVGVAGYQFRYGTNAVLNGEGVSVKNNSYHLEDLDNGKYYFQVRAYDAAGNYSNWSSVQTFTVDYIPPVYLPNEVPQAEYMYGCTATVTGMLLGYYDKFGYQGYDMSKLIAGTVELNARGLDGNAYDMDAFDTVLGSAIASEEYKARFYGQTPAHEYNYTFKAGAGTPQLNTDAWNCIADYLGTGQFWRGNDDLSTPFYYGTLSEIQNYDFTKSITGGNQTVNVPGKYMDVLYGIDLYVKQFGYKLDAEKSCTVLTSNNGGNFDFDDFKAEIDAGRLVMLHITGHTMLAYGYDDKTKEIILDDTYEHDQRMAWGGSYYYSGSNRDLEAVSLVVFDTSALGEMPPIEAPVVSASTKDWTRSAVTLTATFAAESVRNEYSFDNSNWLVYNGSVTVESNKSVYFRAKNNQGKYSNVTEYVVKNIDLTAPTLSVEKPDGWFDTVTLYATVTDDESGAGSIKYSFNNSQWFNYTNAGVKVTANGSVYFKATDRVGNETLQTVEVNAIDDIAPTVEITGNPDEWCRGTVVLKAVVNDAESGVGNIFYSFDNNIWYAYNAAGVEVDANGDVYFKVTDKAGNVQVVSPKVDKLDNTAPQFQININTAKPVKEVVLSVTASDQASGVATVEYSFDNSNWTVGSSVEVSENGSVYFRVTDAVGNVSDVKEYVVSNIDNTTPGTPEVSADITEMTNQTVTVYADFDEDAVKREYSFDNEKWYAYVNGVKMTENGTVYFRSFDSVGNVSDVAEYVVSNIDRIAPEKPLVTADITDFTNKNVTVSAKFAEDSAVKEFSSDGGETWQNYTDGVKMSDNGTVRFRSKDAAGNISEIAEYTVSNIDADAPELPDAVGAKVFDTEAVVEWSDAADKGIAGVAGYLIRYGKESSLTGDGEFTTESKLVLSGLDCGRYYYQLRTQDKAGNLSAWSEVQKFEISDIRNLQSSKDEVSWEDTPGSEEKTYIVEYSPDNFKSVFALETSGTKVDLFTLPQGSYQWQVQVPDSEAPSKGSEIIADNPVAEPQKIVSEANGYMDLFFTQSVGRWGKRYVAEHVGVVNGWAGTGDQVSLAGKNMIADVFEGSSDANILVLSDDVMGDALFVDDVFTSLPQDCDLQARIAMIDEIRAGAGDDLVDMTSQRFVYIGKGAVIYGGDGNDTIWANNGNNQLFGDSGNDRIVGGAADDVIVGGSGNDVMHGGGGNDIFTFGGNFGNDTVEQLADGTVTLYFADGSMDNWDEAGLVYSDNNGNSVKVSGVSADKIILKFDGDMSDLPQGALADSASEKIFEEKNNALLA